MELHRLGVICGALAMAWSSGTIAANDPALNVEQTAFFEQEIRPLLVARCYECHSPEHELEGGLSLASRAGWQTGGESGPAIVPGDLDKSLLLKAVRYSDPDLQMPPKGRLSDAEIAKLEAWVRMGAPDPRDEQALAVKQGVDPEAARTHWAYQPLRATAPPDVSQKEWPRNDVDRYILAALEAKQLSPAPDADRHAWLRRVSLDLTGLPPAPEQVAAFTADDSANAFETVVDRLLSSSAFGERWARPWLDLVGYADQIGSANDVPADHAWRYRDYVIRALNADRPFDQFLREQIAGDLLPAASIEERQDQLTATGFLLLGNVNVVESDKLLMVMDLVDQQIEKVGKVCLGMTLNCVRCQDHKFDPITLKDYYGLAGIFASTAGTRKTDRGVWSALRTSELPETLEQFTARQTALAQHERQVAELRAAKDAAEARLKELEPLIAAAKANPTPPAEAPKLADLEKEKAGLNGKVNDVQRRLWHSDYIRPATPVTYAVHDAQVPADGKIMIRGNPHSPGETVRRGFVAVASFGTVPAIPANESGRRQLADWLTGAAAPLTARVTVNRIWQKLFGRGLVASVDYFGLRGELPSHPELLDLLASQFQREGWSQKRLIRALVLSRTYQQTSTLTENGRKGMAADPENRLLWRMSPRRLEAEMLRDAVLVVSDGLAASQGGPALAPEFMENVGGLDPKDVNPISFSLNRAREHQGRSRTVHLPVLRSSEQRGPAEVLNFFDFPQPAQLVGARPTTTVASQALFLLNGPLMKEAARRLATKLLEDSRLTTDEDRLAALSVRVLGRPFSADETSEAREFLAAAGDGPDARRAAWDRFAQALLVSNEFVFRL